MSPEEMFAALAAPFAPEQVSWRVGSVKKDGTAAMALAYIDARDVMDRLDAVCGPGNWQDRYPHVDKKTVCEIDIYIEGRGWVTKADGAGDSDIEAEKGALSDAFKRAAVRWGVGRYLYHLSSPWVRIDQYKKILPEEMSKLEALLRRDAKASAPVAAPAEPGGAEPSGRKSSAAAKRDGDDVKIKADIAKADRDGLQDWHTNFDSYTAHLPRSWLDSIHNQLELRLEELNGEDRIASEVADLDAGFQGTIGVRAGGDPGVPRHYGSVAA